MDTVALQTLQRTAEWKWTAGAAVNHRDARRIALHHVLVEPHAIVASDDYRLRLTHLDTGVTEPTTIAASPKHIQSDNVQWPEYQRLFPRNQVGTCYIDDAGPIRELYDQVAATMTDTERKRRKDNRPTIIILIQRDDAAPCSADGRRPLTMTGGLASTNGEDRPQITMPFPGRYNAKSEGAFRWAANGAFLVDTLKWANRFTFTDKHSPAEFGNGTGKRIELIMPMFVNW